MDQSLLATIINNHQTTLSRLADAWMDWGASAFYLTDAADKVLAQWPTVVGIGPATFAAPIVMGKSRVFSVMMESAPDVMASANT